MQSDAPTRPTCDWSVAFTGASEYPGTGAWARENGPQYERRRTGTAFDVIRIRGSHHFLQHPDGRCTVVPVHRGEMIGRGLLAQILRDCEITCDDLTLEL